MSKISLKQFLENINTIYIIKPKYKLGSDSFDECDCIGMPKRAHKMAGVTPEGLSGTNYAARYTLKNVKPIKSVSQLKLGDAVLKGRPYDLKDKYPLPSSYLPGGSRYNGDTTNYVHIGTVTQTNPLRITHMTSPTAKIDTSLGKWNYVGQYPQVNYDEEEVVVVVEYALVAGGSLNMRTSPDSSAQRITSIPNNKEVAVVERGDTWCKVIYNAYTGYVMTKYLKFDGDATDDKITIVLSRNDAMTLYEALKASLKL